MTVVIERAVADEATFKACMDLGLAGLHEYAIAPVNFQKALEQAYFAISEGLAFLARNEEGGPVGFVAMMEQDLWYSAERILLNRIGPYIAPGYRFGIVGVKMMKAVRALADERNQLAFIWNTNDRQKTSAATLYAQVSGYIPVGKVIAIRAYHKQQEAA